jgi:hypothetical protein
VARKYAVPRPTYDQADIVISCVDSRAARSAIFHAMPLDAAYWMDLGNRAADGQVVLGTWSEHTAVEGSVACLPHAKLLFPEIADTSIPEDDTPSCGLAQALERQELFVNQSIVTPALEILWRLFRFGCIEWHGAFVNLAAGRMHPLAVDPQHGSEWASRSPQRRPSGAGRKPMPESMLVLVGLLALAGAILRAAAVIARAIRLADEGRDRRMSIWASTRDSLRRQATSSRAVHP